MIAWDRYDLSGAEMRYAIANSPMFLLDGLRSDPEVTRLSQESSAETLMEAFSNSITQPSQNLSDQARPYILAGAAAIKEDYDLLSAMHDAVKNVGGWLEIIILSAASISRKTRFTTSVYKPRILGRQFSTDSSTETTLSRVQI